MAYQKKLDKLSFNLGGNISHAKLPRVRRDREKASGGFAPSRLCVSYPEQMVMALEPEGQTLYAGPHLEVFLPAETPTPTPTPTPTATSLVGSIVGSAIPEGIMDTGIDKYLSNYNHGEAPGLYTVWNSVFK